MLLLSAEIGKQRQFKAVLGMQGNASNASLKCHRKLLFDQTKGLSKSWAGLGSENSYKSLDAQPRLLRSASSGDLSELKLPDCLVP